MPSWTTYKGTVTVPDSSTGDAGQNLTANFKALTDLVVPFSASSIAAGTLAVGHGGTGTSTAFTQGSILFAGSSGVYSQDNANLFWDSTNNRVGLATNSPGSKLRVSGAVATALVKKTGAYTLAESDSVVLVDATSSNVTVTLPSAASITGRLYTIKKIDTSTHTVTIATTSSQTIDGSTTWVLGNSYASATVVSDGSNWFVVRPQILPTRGILWQDDSLATVGTLSSSQDSNQRYCSYTSTTGNGNAFTQAFLLRKGTYNFYALGIAFSQMGKIDWSLDATNFLTGQDWYSSTNVYNTLKGPQSVTVAFDGLHVLKGTINGKNASSSNYQISLTKLAFLPSSD